MPLAVVAFVFIVCLALIALDAVNALDQRRKVMIDAWRDTGNLARSLAQHAEDTFRGVDASIIGVAQRLQIDGVTTDSLDALSRIMAARQTMFPALANTIIVDADGQCVASGRPIPPGRCDFSTNANFRHHQAIASTGPYLGPPIRGPASGAWVIPLSRRFNRADGRFAGIVVGAVSVNHMVAYYETFEIGKKGAILLGSMSKKVLVRRPLRDEDVGRDITDGPLFRELLPKAPSGDAELISPTDGIVRLNSYQTVAGFPLVISVALAKHEALAPWIAELRSRLMRMGGLVLIIGALGTWLVIRVRRHQRLERAYRDTAAAFRLLAENSTDLIVRLGPDMKRLYVSPASRDLLGYEPEEMLGKSTDDIVHPDDRDIWESVFGPAVYDQPSDTEATYRVRRKDGETIWIEVRRRRLASGEGFVLVTRDVTRRKLAEDRLEQANRTLSLIARQDVLTGLANRRHFDETLDAEFRRARRDGTILSLIMIDVDHFKMFNDRYGHPAGDACLRGIAAALKELPERAADLVARYGGEELVIVLPNTAETGALVLAERARQAVHALAIPHERNEGGIVTISLGVASLAPMNRNAQPADLIAAADGALYRAKEGGRDRVCTAGEPSGERLTA